MIRTTKGATSTTDSIEESSRRAMATILFLHGWQSVPGGVKPTYLKDHGHTVINPPLDDDDFDAAVRTAQCEFDRHLPHVVVGSSRGGAVAMNISVGNARLVLLCPAWKKWGDAKTVGPSTVILHSRADDVVPFADSEELAQNSQATLIEVGTDHRLADPEPLAVMLEACESNPDFWWVGLRTILRPGDDGWMEYYYNHPFAQVEQLRTIDICFNKVIDGTYAIDTMDELDHLLKTLPRPQANQYYQMYVDARCPEAREEQPGLTLLGYDLSDWTSVSTLTNCGTWQGELETIAKTVNRYGLLDWEQARRAQQLLPKLWNNAPHSQVTIWAVFEVQVEVPVEARRP